MAIVDQCLWKGPERKQERMTHTYKFTHKHASGQTWKSEDNLQEPVLSSHSVGLGDQIQVVRLDGQYLHLLSHVTWPTVGNLGSLMCNVYRLGVGFTDSLS